MVLPLLQNLQWLPGASSPKSDLFSWTFIVFRGQAWKEWCTAPPLLYPAQCPFIRAPPFTLSGSQLKGSPGGFFSFLFFFFDMPSILISTCLTCISVTEIPFPHLPFQNRLCILERTCLLPFCGNRGGIEQGIRIRV